ncbi:MAG: hypothetical protein WD825_07280 [Gemmatimonadaceae bacterium]
MNIPEYHDEQRLPAYVDAAGRVVLGPLAKIFASPFLGGFTRREQVEENGKPGILVAMVMVDLANDEALPGSYSALGIAKGTNCVWLNVDSGEPSRWIAYVSTVETDAPCDRGRPSDWFAGVPAGFKVLKVQKSDVRNFAPGDFPPVARFDVDAGRMMPLLGVKCLDAWCEIGPAGITVRKPYEFAAAAVDKAQGIKAVRGIKGWHDEQELALRDDLGVWRLSGIRATIIPSEDLDRLNTKTFRDAGTNNTWVTVAEIVVHDNPRGTKYGDKWGLLQGSNFLDLRLEPTGWKTQIRPPGGRPPVPWLFVMRHPHHDAVVPGTARFRWTGGDDTVWTPCGQHCCQVEGPRT